MINLLPPELKEAYHYAHRNVTLVRWVVALGVGLVGLVIISTAGLIYMRQTSNAYTKQIADTTQSLHEQKLTETQAQVNDLTNSLKLATEVLSKEVLFSKLLTQLATVTPSNAVMTDLTIAQAQGAIDITAMTTDYNAAAQFQVNLADPANKIFSKADIVNITCATPSSTDPTAARYPCKVTLRALFANNNPFLFINDKGSA